MVRFQCPECGFGDHEVGHLTAEIETYCVVCLEEDGRLIRLDRWAEERVKPVCAWAPSEMALSSRQPFSVPA
jgi:hypothetical protein